MTSALLSKIDVTDKNGHVGNAKIDTGFSVTKALAELKVAKKCNNLERMAFEKTVRRH